MVLSSPIEMLFIYLCILLTSWIHADNVIDENGHQITTTDISRITETLDDAENLSHEDIQHKTGVIIENIDLITPPNDTLSQHLSSMGNTKKIPVLFFEKLHPHNLLRPIQQKWKEIQDLLAYPFHPNYGGLILLSPQHILGKLKEKGSVLLGGAHNSIFGIAQPPADYPFPYRRAEKKQ